MMMARKWRCSGRRLRIWVLLLLLAASSLALEFDGLPGQWARYGRWEAGATGELGFAMKTNVSESVLLYLDDGGNCDFLELLISDGRLLLRFALHCGEPATLHMETRVNDQRWHRVQLVRNYRHTTLMVDSEAKVAEVKSKRKEMAVASDLFVGGIPPDVRLSALTSSTVKYEPPFRGLIANLKLGESAPVLLDSQGVKIDLEYLCTKQNPCSNGGHCSVYQSDVLCDCTNTGYKGKYCTEVQSLGIKESGGLREESVTPSGCEGLNASVPFSRQQIWRVKSVGEGCMVSFTMLLALGMQRVV
ncbi:hypothetical protein QTP70_009222 [Hemibagrus guttatus]|uniref:Neurexin-2 n=1 Tax=Hemibagrus guttatus TaxID=175788 RepID=A0AAE0QLC5_9TELE|nr:hypothetical protein QTP70_009222 [Hemibagrus guttatus]